MVLGPMNSSQAPAAKLKIFISYSRADISFADQLCAALAAYGIVPAIDREGIHGAEKWEERLGQLILEADTIVFILTPKSAASDICKWEVDRAVKLNKRIVPVVWRPLGEAKAHEYLRGLNYIFFYEELTVTGSGFGTGLARLIDALTTNVTWIREHTRLGELAARWVRDGRPGDALFRGIELSRALDWRKERPANAPELTPLQREFLQASEDAEAQRTNAERRQIEEIRAAQEEREKALKAAEAEQKARAEAQRRNRYLVIAAALLALLLFGGAIWQSRETQRREAVVMTSAANRAIQEQLFERAMRISVQGLPKEGALPIFSLGWSDPAMSGLGGKLAVAAQFSAVRIILTGHGNRVRSAAFSPDGASVVTASDDFTAKVWDAKSGQPLLALSGNGQFATAAFSPDGMRIITATDSNDVGIWDAKTGQLLLKLNGLKAAFSPDGMRIVTALSNNSACVWDARTGKPLVTLQGHTGQVMSADFSPDGERIVTASTDFTTRVWDAKSGDLLLSVHHGNWANSAHFNFDGTRIVTASSNTTAQVWNANTGQELLKLDHGDPVMTAVFSPDGARILTASSSKTTLWDTISGKKLRTFQGHDNFVASAVFSGDGLRIVTASYDKTARIWDAQGEQPLLTLDHNSWVYSAHFSADGAKLVTASGDRVARLWDGKGGGSCSR